MDNNKSLPLQNRKKEKFCRYYAEKFWGDPGGALRAAGYPLNGKKAVDFAELLFDDPEIRRRIVHLRTCRSERSIADESWIKDLLVEIATNALKDSDRIRALASLAKIVMEGGSVRNRSKKQDQSSGENPEQPLLPCFEGLPDGEKNYEPAETD